MQSLKLAENKLKLKLVKQSPLKKLNLLKLGQKLFNKLFLLVVATVVGTPLVSGATVGTVEKQGKQRKLLLTSTNLR